MAGKYDKNIKITVDDNGSLKQKTKDVNKLNKAVDNNSKKSGNLDRNMKGNAKMSANASKNFSKQAQGMQGVLVPAYAEVAARVFALTAAFTALSNVANYNVLIKGQSEYAKMTGKNMSAIARSVQVASKHMLDFKEASTSVALATTSGLGTGQIIKMTKAAVDSSAALGRSMTDTMDRLTRGIVKAEPEILDEIGVIIRLDTVYKNYAQSVSKATAELTEGEKATARYNAIIGQLESKFGGIASKIDPNYFQALASTILDMTNSFGTFVVDGLNPILKWLSKSQGVLGVFMALIAKSLVGKMFPIFSTFGAKISSMPKQMGKNIDKLESKITRLNTSMVKGSKVTSGMIKKQAEQILKPGQRGAAFDKNPMGSTGATLRQARASMEDGVVTYGKLAGKTNKELKKLEKSYTKLNNTVKKGLPLQTRAEAGVHKYTKAVLSAKKGVTSFAASQIRSWSFVTKAIDNRGVISGVSLSVKMLGRAWDKAALSATWYGKAAAGANVMVQGTVGAASALGSVLGKAGHVGMALYATYQIGKMVVGVFADLDTPFMRAAEASTELSASLKTSLESIDEMDSRLSMEGFASNALESTRNADFAANMGEELYNATSKAMKKLKADISTRSFWDDFADFFMSIVGKGLKDTLTVNISGSIDAMKKLKTDVTSVNNLIDKLHKGKKTKLVQTNVGQQVAGATLMGVSPVLAKYKAVQKTRKELIADLSESDALVVMGLINDVQKQTSDTAKLLATDIKNLGTQFDKVAKSAKTYKESLIEATAVDEMAAAQEEIKKIWESDTLSGADKVFQAQGQGFLKQGSVSVKALEAAQKTQAGLKKKWLEESKNDGKDFAESSAFKNTQKIITDWAKAVYSETTNYLDVMDEDWLTMQKDALNATTDRINAEMRLNLLQKFAKNSSIGKQAKQAELIAKAKWSEAAAADALLQKDDTVSYERKLQSSTKLAQLKLAANVAGARELDIATEINKRQGTTLTLTERYDAKLKDLRSTLKGIEGSIGKNYVKQLFDKERAAAAEKSYYKILNANNKNFKVRQQILAIESEITEIINARVNGATEKDRAKLTRMALLNLTKEGKTIKSRHEAIDAEMEKIIIEDAHWEKGQAVLDYKMRVAKIEREVTDERFKKEKQILAYRELMLEKARLETGIARVELEKSYTFIRSGLTTTNNEFNSTIATTLSDALMNLQYGDDKGFDLPSTDDVRYFLAKTMSDQVGSFVGGLAEKGLVKMESKFLELIGFGEDEINQMLPADPIREMANSLKAIEGYESNISAEVKGAGMNWSTTSLATRSMAQVSQVTPELWAKLIDKAEKEKGEVVVDSVIPQIESGPYQSNISTVLTALNQLLKRADRDQLTEEALQGILVTTEEQKNIFSKFSGSVLVSEDLYKIVRSKIEEFDTVSGDKLIKTVDDLIRELNKVKWGDFGTSIRNLTEAYKAPVREEDGSVTPGGFAMHGFTPAVGKAMQEGMSALASARAKDGRFGVDVARFDGESLKAASDKINAAIAGGFLKILGFDGESLKQASSDLSSAFQEGAFKVDVQNFADFDIGSSIDKSIGGFFNTNQIDPAVEAGKELTGAALEGMEALSKKGSAYTHDIHSEALLERIANILESNTPITAEQFAAASVAGAGGSDKPIKYQQWKDGNWKLGGQGGRFADGKPGMTTGGRGMANLDAMRDKPQFQSTKAWLDDYSGKSNNGKGSVGAHKTGSGFPKSNATPYSMSGAINETRIAQHAEAIKMNQVKDLKIKGVDQAIKDIAKKMDMNNELRRISAKNHTNPDIEQSRAIKPYLTKAGAAEEKAKLVKSIRDSLVKSTSAANAASAASEANFFAKLAEWWNKGRSGTESTRNWMGSGGLIADDASKMAHTTKAFKEGTTSAATLRPWKAFLDMDILKTGPTPAVRQAFERTLGPILRFLEKANPYFLALETMTISGSTPSSQKLGQPQANIDSYKIQQSNAFTTEAEHLMLQKLIDAQQLILDKMPDKETAELANSALAHADDGPGNSLGINLHNPESLTNTSLGIAADASATAKQGIRQLVTSGEINTRSLAASFAGSVAGKATDKAVDAIWGWGMSFFAKGGIAPGGFRAFANGGTVKQPTLGLIGEGKYNEAVVPLPDGKSIPVTGSTGSTENNITVNVTVDSAGNAKTDSKSGMDGDKAKALGYMVSQAVQQELVEQKRPGGLLSQY